MVGGIFRFSNRRTLLIYSNREGGREGGGEEGGGEGRKGGGRGGDVEDEDKDKDEGLVHSCFQELSHTSHTQWHSTTYNNHTTVNSRVFPFSPFLSVL